jgi:hypothetical protein
VFNCNRGSDDPILKVFVKEHQLNLLKMPRQGISIGDVMITREGKTFLPVTINDVFKGEKPFNPTSSENKQSPFDTTFSQDISAKAVINFMEALAASYEMSASGNLKSAYKNARSARVRVNDVRKTVAKLGDLTRWLSKATIDPEQNLMREGDKVYVVTAVVKSNDMEVTAFDDSGKAINIDVAATGLADASAEFSAQAKVGASRVYKAKDRLAFGVELNELVYSGGTWHLDLPDGWVDVRGGREEKNPKPVFLGGSASDGEAFIDFENA